MDGLARSLWPEGRDRAWGEGEVTGQQIAAQGIDASVMALRAIWKGQFWSLCAGSYDRDAGLGEGSCGGLGRREDLGSDPSAAPSWPRTTLTSLTQETVQ